MINLKLIKLTGEEEEKISKLEEKYGARHLDELFFSNKKFGVILEETGFNKDEVDYFLEDNRWNPYFSGCTLIPSFDNWEEVEVLAKDLFGRYVDELRKYPNLWAKEEKYYECILSQLLPEELV